jgi:hypothetical protein
MHHFPILAIRRHQCFMSSQLNDLTGIQDNNSIRVFDCAQAMGDHETGPTRHQGSQTALNAPLTQCIQIARRLVKNQNPWIG